MTVYTDDFQTVILGTGNTTEVQIGSNTTGAGSALVVPANTRALLKVVPYQAGNAVVTASESITTRYRMDSNDVKGMIPKIVVLPEILGGLGATTAHLIPQLQSFLCNTPLTGGERINAYAQPLVANTTATIVGAVAVYSDVNVRGAEEYYLSTTNTTITAPAAGTRSAGANVTITGGKHCNFAQPHISSVVQTAAQAFIGVAELTSNDIVQSGPWKWPTQPVGGFLGATNSPYDSNGDTLNIDEPITFKTNGQTIFQTFWTNRVIQTGNVNFNMTLGYTTG